MNALEPIDIRTGRPFASRRAHLYRPSIDGESIAGGWGRARGLLGGAFMGCMMAPSRSNPYDYEVEYIETLSPGGYFDTGVNASDVLDFEVMFRVTSNPSGSAYLFGSDGAGNTRLSIAVLGNSLNMIEYRCGDYGRDSSKAAVGEDVTVMIDAVTGKSYLDDMLTVTSSYNRGNTTFASHSMLIMTSRDSSGNVRNTTGRYRLYAYKMHIADGRTMNLIPVVKDGVPCLYDTYSGVIFGSLGTGSFVAGPAVHLLSPTARDYVQDGLIHQWDGIENAGFGVHDNSATGWTDLVGNVGFSLTSRASWSDSGLVFDNTSAVADRTIGFAATLECVFEHSSVSMNNKVVVLNCESNVSGSGSSRGIFYNQNATEGLGYYFDGNQVKTKILQTDGSKKSVAVTWAAGSHKSVSAERYLNSVRSAYDGEHSSSWGVVNHPYLCIGGQADNPTGYTYGGLGVMYALRLYNRALTAAEIAANYAVDKARFNLP